MRCNGTMNELASTRPAACPSSRAIISSVASATYAAILPILLLTGP
jgi:hypothetical protein